MLNLAKMFPCVNSNPLKDSSNCSSAVELALIAPIFSWIAHLKPYIHIQELVIAHKMEQRWKQSTTEHEWISGTSHEFKGCLNSNKNMRSSISHNILSQLSIEISRKFQCPDDLWDIHINWCFMSKCGQTEIFMTFLRVNLGTFERPALPKKDKFPPSLNWGHTEIYWW